MVFRLLGICMMCLIAATAFVSAQTIIPGGNVSGIWTATGSPYLIQGEITVPVGETLNIQPGVEVNFQGHYKLIVNGWLEAIGTETDSILFTAEDTVVGWWSIRFIDAPDTSHVEYCVIQHSHAIDPDCNGGAIYCYYSNPFINHCTIRKNSASSSGYDGNGGGICCDHSSPIISHCDISENYARWVGGGIFDMGSSYSISYCTIRGNSAGAGGGVYVNGSTANIDHCIIINNMANPLNGGGIGLWLYYGTPVLNISNSVFEGNGGEACIDFYCTNYGSIVYNDFYNNQGGSFAGTVPQNLGQIVTVNANGDPCDMFYNIFEDPLFADTASGNFQITWQNFPIDDSTRSACIDAGNPSSPLDPDSTIADIGAFYFNQWTGTIIPGGDVSGIWTASGSPYLIQGEITVPIGQTLNIQPGVDVIFQGHYKLIVYGWLEAIGTETDSILFTAEDTVTGWAGIRFLEAPDNSHLSYCTIKFGKAIGAISQDCRGGGIYGEESSPVISHCNITQNWAAYCGGGMYFGPRLGLSNYSNPTISYCSISGNSASYQGDITFGGGIYCVFSNINISYCIINDNSAYYGGGIDMSYASNLNINHCTISENSSSGIRYAGSNAQLTMANTIVEGNGGNGGIYFYYLPAYYSITYGDFHDNVGGNFAGSGVPPGLGIVDTVNANGDSCDIFFNIFEDPLFADPINGNFQITWVNWPVWDSTRSPCIDAGDPASSPDPDSTIADIGALYFDQPYVPSPPQVSLTPYNPPIIIPPEGGDFTFNIQFTNNSSDTAQFDAWISIEMPNGHEFMLEGPVCDITLTPGGMIERDRRVFVPPNAPAGEYSCIAMIGTYPWNVIGSDAFAFIKEGTNIIWKGSKGWRITGESFDK